MSRITKLKTRNTKHETRNSEPNPRLIIICGPTGVGKTEMAIRFATTYGGEIISADSMQVYRYMNIGTAKPAVEERLSVKHHLIDVVNPDEEFNASLFVKDAGKIIDKLDKNGENIFVAGGTGLYIKALLGGLFKGPGADSNLRNSYKGDLKKFGSGYLYEKLESRDRIAAGRIHPNDAVRIIRALEVFESTGESIAQKHEEHRFGCRAYDYIKIGLILDRKTLYERIDRRTEKMISDGLIEEVEDLLKRGFGESLKPMQSMCYKHITNYIKGRHDLFEAIRLIKRDTRHYAKRQLTWFSKENDIKWHYPQDCGDIKDEIERFLDV